MEKYIFTKHGQSTFWLLEITNRTVNDDSKSERSLMNQLESDL